MQTYSGPNQYVQLFRQKPTKMCIQPNFSLEGVGGKKTKMTKIDSNQVSGAPKKKNKYIIIVMQNIDIQTTIISIWI